MTDPNMDFRVLVGRLDTGRTLNVDVTFSPDECWLLREHIRALQDEIDRRPPPFLNLRLPMPRSHD